jgi:hypothetical protein
MLFMFCTLHISYTVYTLYTWWPCWLYGAVLRTMVFLKPSSHLWPPNVIHVLYIPYIVYSVYTVNMMALSALQCTFTDNGLFKALSTCDLQMFFFMWGLQWTFTGNGLFKALSIHLWPPNVIHVLYLPYTVYSVYTVNPMFLALAVILIWHKMISFASSV